MSIKTWMAEFYPVTAEVAVRRGDDPVTHSLRKWRGLTDDNLAKHNLVRVNCRIQPQTPGSFAVAFAVDDTTCALCVAHLYRDTGGCNGCPLYALRDSLPCDVPASRGGLSPYTHYTLGGDPAPMIALLEQAADGD